MDTSFVAAVITLVASPDVLDFSTLTSPAMTRTVPAAAFAASAAASLMPVVWPVLPTLVCGLCLAIQDARTHSILPAHVFEGLVAQVLWFMAADRTGGKIPEGTVGRIGAAFVIAAFSTMIVWCASLLPGRPIGDGDAFTTLLFVFALDTPMVPDGPISGAGACPDIGAGVVRLVVWCAATAVCAVACLALRTTMTVITMTVRRITPAPPDRRRKRPSCRISDRFPRVSPRIASSGAHPGHMDMEITMAGAGPETAGTGPGMKPEMAFVPAQYAGFVLTLLLA